MCESCVPVSSVSPLLTPPPRLLTAPLTVVATHTHPPVRAPHRRVIVPASFSLSLYFGVGLGSIPVLYCLNYLILCIQFGCQVTAHVSRHSGYQLYMFTFLVVK